MLATWPHVRWMHERGCWAHPAGTPWALLLLLHGSEGLSCSPCSAAS